MDETAFSGDWLQLREPADHRARNPVLRQQVVAALAGRAHPVIVDLGAGTGSSARALAPLLPAGQTWRLVDQDAAHLADARKALAAVTDCAGGPISVETHEWDLTGELPAWLFDGADLIVASAFFDLVSRRWLERLALGAARVGATVYAALSVDGRLAAEPFNTLDSAVFDAFNMHMLQDKGFGGALGPRAADIAAHVFRAEEFRVATAKADWDLGPDEAELQRQLIGFWADAAAQMHSLPAADLADWRRRSLAAIAAGSSRLSVGHIDLLATPTRAA